jgi:DNA-binding NarL/FixJ family response regulator
MIRVLVADDHPIVRAGLRALIEGRMGLSVVGEAADGNAAVEAAASLEPDVVLMDLAMPRLDGFDATRRITCGCPNTRVLVLTTYASDADAVRAMDAGATGYLLKDAAPDEIVAAIRTVAAGAPAVAPEVAPYLMRRLRGERATGSSGSPTLTTRELEILAKVAKGSSNKAIARELRISEATVKTHLIHVFEKLGVDDRTAAVTVAMSRGILRLASSTPSR